MKKSGIIIGVILLAATLLCCLVLGACYTGARLTVTFDDSHVVREGNELDSLKPFLTVIYVDRSGNKEQAEGYLLQGTLQKGSCVLTVVYAGLSATVNVNVVAKDDVAVKGTRGNPYTLEEAYFEAPKLGEGGYSAQPVYVKAHVEMAEHSGDVWVILLKEPTAQYRIMVYIAVLGEGVTSVEPNDLVLVCGYLHFINGEYANPPQLAEHDGEPCTVVECVHPSVREITLSVDKTVLEGDDVATFTVTTVPAGQENEVKLVVEGMGNFVGDIVGNKFVPDADIDAEVVVYAELDGIVSNYVHFEVWGGGKTASEPLSVFRAVERAEQIDGYSAQAYHVRGVLASEMTAAIRGYTFSLCDEDYPDVTVTVVNAVLNTQADDIKPGDSLTVLGNIYAGPASAAMRVPNGETCTVEQWYPQTGVKLTLSADKTQLKEGESATLSVTSSVTDLDLSAIRFEITYGSNVGHFEDNVFFAERAGQCGVRAALDMDGNTYYSNEIAFTVIGGIDEEVTIVLKADKYLIEYSDNTFVYAAVQPALYASQLTFEIIDGQDVARLIGNAQTQRSLLPMDQGFVTVTASVGQYRSNPVTIQIIRYDPYTNIGASGFYDRYTPAADLEDSYWRTKHNLMSGSIAEQNQAPTISPNRPTQGSKFVRNTDENFFDNGNSYKVVDYNGSVVNTIYKCGAYVTLEEVAAYVYAWGNVPANYTADKGDNPQSNAWGKFLRLNNSYYSGDTSRYPYEPVMPNIDGAGGSLSYYEIDIGTTGTDCDPKYVAAPYNDGYSITRGAARIVYARYDNQNNLLAPTERYVFYTYNHYNDFQEYLNYQGGWGEMFGNITGGGQISSDHYYNPTPYVATALCSFGCK